MSQVQDLFALFIQVFALEVKCFAASSVVLDCLCEFSVHVGDFIYIHRRFEFET